MELETQTLKKTNKGGFEIEKLLEHRVVRNKREFKVLWKPCMENGYRRDEVTWEAEASLRDDGRGRLLSAWLRRQSTAPVARRNRASGSGKLGR